MARKKGKKSGGQPEDAKSSLISVPVAQAAARDSETPPKESVKVEAPSQQPEEVNHPSASVSVAQVATAEPVTTSTESEKDEASSPVTAAALNADAPAETLVTDVQSSVEATLSDTSTPKVGTASDAETANERPVTEVAPAFTDAPSNAVFTDVPSTPTTVAPAIINQETKTEQISQSHEALQAKEEAANETAQVETTAAPQTMVETKQPIGQLINQSINDELKVNEEKETPKVKAAEADANNGSDADDGQRMNLTAVPLFVANEILKEQVVVEDDGETFTEVKRKDKRKKNKKEDTQKVQKKNGQTHQAQTTSQAQPLAESAAEAQPQSAKSDEPTPEAVVAATLKEDSIIAVKAGDTMSELDIKKESSTVIIVDTANPSEPVINADKESTAKPTKEEPKTADAAVESDNSVPPVEKASDTKDNTEVIKTEQPKAGPEGVPTQKETNTIPEILNTNTVSSAKETAIAEEEANVAIEAQALEVSADSAAPEQKLKETPIEKQIKESPRAQESVIERVEQKEKQPQRGQNNKKGKQQKKSNEPATQAQKSPKPEENIQKVEEQNHQESVQPEIVLEKEEPTKDPQASNEPTKEQEIIPLNAEPVKEEKASTPIEPPKAKQPSLPKEETAKTENKASKEETVKHNNSAEQKHNAPKQTTKQKKKEEPKKAEKTNTSETKHQVEKEVKHENTKQKKEEQKPATKHEATQPYPKPDDGKVRKDEVKADAAETALEDRKPKTISISEDDDGVFEVRPVFLPNTCHVCKEPHKGKTILKSCAACRMIAYCSSEHQKEHWPEHKQICKFLKKELEKQKKKHIFEGAKDADYGTWKRMRYTAMMQCEDSIKRPLQPYEREMFLFPRHCETCYETDGEKLHQCKSCSSAFFCSSGHKRRDHDRWCAELKLLFSLTVQQAKTGRIEPPFPDKVFQQYEVLPGSMKEFLVTKMLGPGGVMAYGDVTFACLTETASYPLTLLYTLQKLEEPKPELEKAAAEERGRVLFNPKPINELKSMVIHVVGAELAFECDSIIKWDVFFVHLLPNLQHLRVVFIGPELVSGSGTIPTGICDEDLRCPHCASADRKIEYDFQPGRLYQDYIKSEQYIKPNVIVAYNCGLYRETGYSGTDTWGPCINAMTADPSIPVVLTAYTSAEAPKDTARVLRTVSSEVLLTPQKNPYRSLKPCRNFVDEESAPVMYKNNFFSVVHGV